MTYKEIINRFRTVTNDHLVLKDFGYGQLTDLKTQSQLGPEEQGVDYPYLFLLPQTSQRTGPVMNYSFNMIVMDMARPEEGDQYDNYITIQSQCQQYIDDILSQLYYYYSDQPEIQLTGINYTPFKEKYQDELAGMTATITIAVPAPIDNCIAPFNDPSIFGQVLIQSPMTVNPDPNGAILIPIQPPQIDVNGWWLPGPYDAFYVPGGQTYRITVTGEVEQYQPTGGEVVCQEPPGIKPHEIINDQPVFTPGNINPVYTNWPTTYTPGPQQFTAEFEWEAPSTTGTWSLNTNQNGEVGQDESNISLTNVTYTFRQ